MPTYARFDGSQVADFFDFVRELGRVLPGTTDDYFGWDILSFQDCLYGGFADDPPYVITVLDAEPMVEAFGYEGRARYDEAMVQVARSGGRGLVEADHVDWYLDDALEARRREGETLLQTVESVIWKAGSILALVFDESLRVVRPIDCWRCGERVVEWIGQHLRHDELTYYCSQHCPSCGGMEADSRELCDPQLRSLVLAATGIWSLVVTGWSERVAGMARLRKLCGLALAEVNRRMQIGNSVAEGTKVEMVRLRRALTDAGVSCELRIDLTAR